jgi:hypothetical protein
MTFTTLFLILATVGVIAVPWWFLRDIRSRHPRLWERIGSPVAMTESSVSLPVKIFRGLYRLRCDESLTDEERLYCSRYWWLLLVVYGLEVLAICLMVRGRFGPQT